MIPNRSPWIKQLNRTRPVLPIAEDVQSDVAIIGGGIAGVVTAFFILRDTDKKVVMIEGDKIAHGATGHNAGQVTSYFEKPLSVLIEEFGEKLAVEGQRSVESAWLLVDEIFAGAKLSTPLYRFQGYTGLSEFEQVITYLKVNKFREKHGLFRVSVLLAKEWDKLGEIPEEYKDLYSIVPQKDLLQLLETDNREYIACLSYPKGCMNSALFSEELVGFLLATYKDRFALYEGSPMKLIRLGEDEVVLEVLNQKVKVKKAVLCTNGFANFEIVNEKGKEINTNFHHSVHGRIGYMAGYVDPLNNPPTAVSYFPRVDRHSSDPTGESYFYLTRRPHEREDSKTLDFNLICAGGPEKVLPNGASYSREAYCSDDTQTLIDDFLHKSYAKYKKNDTEYAFCWHGLMGYTPNGVRIIGAEPLNTNLLYNLGCNGVGILPSIYGGHRIAEILKGGKLEETIFDPRDQSV